MGPLVLKYLIFFFKIIKIITYVLLTHLILLIFIVINYKTLFLIVIQAAKILFK